MTTPPHHLPLTPSSITAAHTLIKPHIHHTPILTNKTLNALASSPHPRSILLDKTPTETHTHTNNDTDTDTDTDTATPKINFFFKCENLQRIGAFKARGAFHALLRLVEVEGVEVVRERGVVTHSSGNHAQALSLASSTLSIPCTIIMPTISTPSKISGTAAHGARILFSGSTSVEREALVAEVMRETNAFLIPPYDHPDIILGQGTVGYEMAGQVGELLAGQPGLSVHFGTGDCKEGAGELDAVITPVGGGGLNAGVATYFADRAGTLVFGAEPSYQGGDDCARGLREGRRVERVSTLTVADGLRTPVGVIPWGVISDSSKVAGVYAVSEEEILAAMRLVLERMKVVIEPSAAVGVAVVLFNEEFRARVVRECKEGGLSGWDVGVVFSGGNTTVERIGELFAKK